MEANISLPHSQEPTTGPSPEPVHIFPLSFIRETLLLKNHLFVNFILYHIKKCHLSLSLSVLI